MRRVLEMKEVSKEFTRMGRQTFTALENVSFSLNAGEVLGIVGESGSGKSTIAKLATGLIDATAGSIFLEDTDITKKKGTNRRIISEDIQMVFQNPTGSFDPRRTLGDGIATGLRCKGMNKRQAWEKASEMLRNCGLPEEYMNRYPHQVSGGQCQRAAIARALVVKPKILICDEATSALDVTIQKQMMELLESIKKSHNMSYLFICHNLALVQDFCDRILVMQNGRIIESGTPDEIIRHPQTEYTKRLIASVLL